MKNDTKQWLEYAEENLAAAKVLFESHLYNPCLQNIQQCIEKFLKAIFIEKAIKLKRSHSISELKNLLADNKIEFDITDDECELLDSIYLPSKYPVGSALPYFHPDEEICKRIIAIAERTQIGIRSILPE